MNENDFKELVWQKGRELYRDMPWRRDTQPYYVLVSELMLQQTQVDRVIPKFEAFIHRFPDVPSLASASLGEVLVLWSGLGYNRRSKFLYEATKLIDREYDGAFPQDYQALLRLPGVGPGTAGAIMVYAFNQSVPFIETNVRTVYFHHLFDNVPIVDDRELLEVVRRTIDPEHPRDFYWALMDYGTWLKKHGFGRLVQSKHYKKQAPLKGSVREVRGQIIRTLTTGDKTIDELKTQVTIDERFEGALQSLLADGLIKVSGNRFHLTK